jgi:hypothetical protein
LYEKVYCARGEMENRIKECQLDLFADRTSTATMQANQLRLWLLGPRSESRTCFQPQRFAAQRTGKWTASFRLTVCCDSLRVACK